MKHSQTIKLMIKLFSVKMLRLECFVSLFAWGYTFHSRIFRSYIYEDLTIRDELLSYSHARGHWAVRVLWHSNTCCDTGHPFIMSSPRTRDTHTYCRAFGSGAVSFSVFDLGLSRLGFKDRRDGVEEERSPRVLEIGIRSPVATDLSRKNR